jgi:hypothetical protein
MEENEMKITVFVPQEINIPKDKAVELFDAWIERWKPDSIENPAQFENISVADFFQEAVLAGVAEVTKETDPLDSDNFNKLEFDNCEMTFSRDQLGE